MEFAELVRIGREPTPTDLQPVVVQILEQHQSLKRADLAAEVERKWREAGGTPLKSVFPRLKKTLQILEAEGIAAPAGTFGVWSLVASDTRTERRFESTAALDELDDGPEDVDESLTRADNEIGSGAQLVYCFYLPLYRQSAEGRGDSRWPIKIGMTTGPLVDRIAALSTSMPEIPKLGLVIRTENAALLERVIHGVLACRHRRDDSAGGAEWFLTNIEEIRSIYAFVTAGDADATSPAALSGAGLELC